MPRNIRNWWLTLDVDGKKSTVATGPRSRTGGFSCTIRMRSDGGVHEEMLLIEGTADDGLLNLRVSAGGEEIFRRTTKA